MSRTKISKFQDTKPITDGLIFYCGYNKQVDANYSIGSPIATLITGNLKGIWHFEDGAGDPTDESGLGNILTNNGGDWNANGKYGSAIDFIIANSDYLVGATAGDSDFQPGAGDFSAGFWLKDAADIGDSQVPMGMHTTDSWRFLVRPSSGGKMQFLVSDGAENALRNGSLGDATDGDWHFYVMTWDVSTGTLRAYVDAVPETPAVNTNVNNISPTGKIAIGRRDSAADRYLTGTVDEPFFLKGTLLTQGEVTMLFENRWWGRTYLDGKFGQAYFGADGNSLKYDTAGNINKDQGTIEMWVTPSWDGDDGNLYRFLDLRTDTPNVNRLGLWKHTNNNLYFSIWDENGVARHSNGVINSTTFGANTRHHIVGTWDNDGLLSIYLDGELLDTTNTGGTGKLLALASTMNIGTSTSNANDVRASIDEFKIYDRPLTAQEIEQNFKAQVPVGN